MMYFNCIQQASNKNTYCRTLHFIVQMSKITTKTMPEREIKCWMLTKKRETSKYLWPRTAHFDRHITQETLQRDYFD